MVRRAVRKRFKRIGKKWCSLELGASESSFPRRKYMSFRNGSQTQILAQILLFILEFLLIYLSFRVALFQDIDRGFFITSAPVIGSADHGKSPDQDNYHRDDKYPPDHHENRARKSITSHHRVVAIIPHIQIVNDFTEEGCCSDRVLYFKNGKKRCFFPRWTFGFANVQI